MRRALAWFLGALAALIFLLVTAAGAGYAWLLGSLPMVEGERVIAGLEAPVEVLRDADGMVTIRAGGERDAALALGYVHAQDRLWQMDFMRRSGAGRLSEVLGRRTLRLDRFMRTLGLYRVAEANLRVASAPLRALLAAYTIGVNAVIEDRSGTLPLEFHLLRYRPEPWRPADSMVWGRLMALQLSGNWGDEVLRARLARRLTPAQIRFLWPAYPTDAPIAIEEFAAELGHLPLARFAGLLPWELAPKDASNSWVLAGSRTATGAPILANDPHLALSAPGVWYLARIETPSLTLAGATAPGLPMLVLGHNGAIAWGFTTTHSDTQDLFIERPAGGDPARYLAPGGPLAFETRQETIRIRGGEPDLWTVRRTRHGPVISDLLADPPTPRSDPQAVLALAWPGLRGDDRTADGLYRINRARDWQAFRAALEDLHSPHQNIVFADRDGAIGFAAPARVPIRKAGDGWAPVPGWSGEFDWVSEVPLGELPVAADPPAGRIVAANNKIVGDGYPYLLTADWKDPYRARRISDLLDSGRDAGRRLEDSLAMQQDVTSLAARDLLPLLLAAEPETDPAREAVEILAQWDGRMDRDNPAPLLFHAWVRELNRVLLADELGPEFADFQRPRIPLLSKILRHGHAWCDDVGTEAVAEGCAGQLTVALEAAVRDLGDRYRRPLRSLRWGEAHVARFAHPVLGRVPLLGRFFDLPIETAGSGHTVNRGGTGGAADSTYPFEHVHGAGYRAVYDLADPDNSRFMIAPGQSGNPLSPHYGDLAERWRDGDYVRLAGAGRGPLRRLWLRPK